MHVPSLSSSCPSAAAGSRWFARLGLSAALVVFVACMATVMVGSYRPSRSPARASVAEAASPGAPAQPFRLPDLDARLLSLADFRGRVVLMCITDADPRGSGVLPRLHDAVEPFAADRRVQAVTIFRTESFPGSAELTQLRMDMAAAGLRCPILLDVTSGVSHDYRAARGTSLFVIDTTGVIRHRADDADRRPAAFAEAQEVVAGLLGEGRSPVAVLAAAVPVAVPARPR